MSREETAVALSHIQTWHRVIEEDRRYALILEDDVFFEAGFAKQLNQTWSELPKSPTGAPDFDVLYVSFSEVARGAHRTSCTPNVLRLRKGYWWLSGYVVSNEGARKLLASLPVTGPVDLWMNLRAAELKIYSTPRSIISQRTDLQSDNKYSILPLLSQIGVQSDKSHLLLEQARGKRPVFCVGFGAQSSVRLQAALSLLAYRSCHDVQGFCAEAIDGMLNDGSPLLFDAYIGVRPLSVNVRWLIEQYPDASFVVPPSFEYSCEVNSAEYASAIAELKEGKRDVLVVDMLISDGWPTLCRFLGCTQPDYPFPTRFQAYHTLPTMPGPSLSARTFTVQEHDVHPWIVPNERLAAFGIARKDRDRASRAGTFEPKCGDDQSCFEQSRWIALTDSFPSNLAQFTPDNVAFAKEKGYRLTLDAKGTNGRGFSAGSICSKQSFLYGRFEAMLQPACAPGVVTAFFLHRNDPWQEIDIEFLGADTSQLLINVYFNPGMEGTKCNFGNRGTPVVIDLGFNAAEAFHRYAIEWEPHEIRWFVDGDLVHVRGIWEPTPIPNLPMQLFCSIWPPRSVELAGSLRTPDLPVHSDLRLVKMSTWSGQPWELLSA